MTRYQQIYVGNFRPENRGCRHSSSGKSIKTTSALCDCSWHICILEIKQQHVNYNEYFFEPVSIFPNIQMHHSMMCIIQHSNNKYNTMQYIL